MNNIEEVLKMVKDGILSVEDAAKLLNAMEHNSPAVTAVSAPVSIPNDYKKKMLRVFVESADGDVIKVNVPVAIVLAGIDIASKFQDVKMNNHNFDMSQIDFEMIKQCVQSGMVGEIINVESANGDVIKIFIE
ncbi:MAG: hypothetical protein VB012_00905 [Erysipelotrichaceae bacterium]|nr:hypothetical protein [Erysipelotrichaceae bacterium]